MNKDFLNNLLINDKLGIDKAVRLISNFQKGKLKPLKTSMEHLNSVALGGLIPGLVISIAARASHGKTHTLHTLKNDILHPDNKKVRMLLYNWEMPWFSLILIQLKKMLKKPFKVILGSEPTKDELIKYKEVMEKFRDDRLTTVTKPLTPEEWDYVTRTWIEQNKEQDLLIIATDHLGITVGTDKTNTIYRIMEFQNNIKLDYEDKVCFINLCQLNREIETLWRSKDTNPTKLRVSSNYIFGADAMTMYSDIVMAQVIPERADMDLYTAVNRERYKHLSEHFDESGKAKDGYVRLKGLNRIYYDYIKRRMDDDDPTLYCEVLNKEKEEFINATSLLEGDLVRLPEPPRMSEDELLF